MIIKKNLGDFFDCSKIKFSKGIPHFLAADSKTQLDEYNYDTIYNGDVEKNINDFKKTADQVAPFFDQPFGNVLEIGAGTGRFSVGFFKQVDFKKYLISDVSIKMLLQLKNKLIRLNRINKSSREIYLLGLDCENFRSREEVFDLVTASGVLHHILTYENLLKNLFRALNKNGSLYLLEPNLSYHIFMADILGFVLRAARIVDKYKDSSEFLKLQNWRTHNYLLKKYNNEKQYIKNLEDKFFFDRDKLYHLLKKIGFNQVEFIPRHSKPEYSQGLETYMNQLQMSNGIKSDVLCEIENLNPDLLRVLKPEALHPAFHIIAQQTKMIFKPRKPDILELPLKEKLNSFKLKGVVDKYIPGVEIAGWFIAQKEIRKVKFKESGKTIEVILTIPRPDVKEVFKNNFYPDDNIFYSGFEGRPEFIVELSKAVLEFEFCDGENLQVNYTDFRDCCN